MLIPVCVKQLKAWGAIITGKQKNSKYIHMFDSKGTNSKIIQNYHSLAIENYRKLCTQAYSQQHNCRHMYTVKPHYSRTLALDINNSTEWKFPKPVLTVNLEICVMDQKSPNQTPSQNFTQELAQQVRKSQCCVTQCTLLNIWRGKWL